MKTYFKLILLLITSFFTSTFSQVPPPESFFPSAVGNVWEFNTDVGFIRREILRDSIGIDKSQYLYTFPNSSPIYKIDTALNVYWYNFNTRKLI